MKKRMIIALVCVLLLVVATFVACDDTPNTPTPQGVVKNPVATPNLNYEYDAKCTENHSHSDSLAMEHDEVAIWIDITNAESINNLFYDYKSTDFINEEVIINEKKSDVLSMLREKVKNNDYDIETIRQLSRFCRRLVIIIEDKESVDVMECLREIRQRNDVRCASLTPSGPAGWFATTANDPFITEQWGNDKIDLAKVFELTR